MPYKDKEKARRCSLECKKRYRTKHYELGLCSDCSNIAIVGKTYCEKCLEKLRTRSLENNIQRYYDRKKQNVCQKCNSLALDGHVFCVLHLNNGNHYSYTFRRERKSKNLCRECGAPVVKGIYCVLHLSKCILESRHRYRDNPVRAEQRKQYSKERYHKLKSENKCVSCGMQLNEESRMGVLCLTCYSKQNGYF